VLSSSPVVVSKISDVICAVFVSNVPSANHVITVAVKVIAPVPHEAKFVPVRK
jgi:hypothetical protein